MPRFTGHPPIRAKALLFDMDGTLILSHTVFERTWRRWAARHGVDPEPIIAHAHGRRTLDAMAEFCPPDLSPELEAAAFAQAESEDVDGIVAIAGAAAFVGALPPERWALVTSADRRLAKVRLNAAGLPFPSTMITAEDVAKGKPDPEGYLKAARRLGFAPEETVVFEDAPAGLAAGRAAGARVIALDTILSPEALEVFDWIEDYRGLGARTDGDDTIILAASQG